MIEYLKGELTELTPALAVIECGGVGYGLNISLTTYAAIQGKPTAKLYVYEAIREDAYTLWGFAGRSEREMFLLLTTVKGVGAATARMILSAYTVAELSGIITAGELRALKAVKGVGPMAAQRIVVDLKDKLPDVGSTAGKPGAPAAAAVNAEVRDEATAALTMLGFSPAPTKKAVEQILTEDPAATVEAVIKKALKML